MGRTPGYEMERRLYSALYRNNFPLFRSLLRRGADPNISFIYRGDDWGSLYYLIDHSSYSTEEGFHEYGIEHYLKPTRYPILFHAVLMKRYAFVRELGSQPAIDLYVSANYGDRYALDCAIFRGEGYGSLRMVRLLLDLLPRDTPATVRHLSMVLIKYACNRSSHFEELSTTDYDLRLIELLLKYGATIEDKNEYVFYMFMRIPSLARLLVQYRPELFDGDFLHNLMIMPSTHGLLFSHPWIVERITAPMIRSYVKMLYHNTEPLPTVEDRLRTLLRPGYDEKGLREIVDSRRRSFFAKVLAKIQIATFAMCCQDLCNDLLRKIYSDYLGGSKVQDSEEMYYERSTLTTYARHESEGRFWNLFIAKTVEKGRLRELRLDPEYKSRRNWEEADGDAGFYAFN